MLKISLISMISRSLPWLEEFKNQKKYIVVLTDDGIVDGSVLPDVLVYGSDLPKPGAGLQLLLHLHTQGHRVLLTVKPGKRGFFSSCELNH